MVFPHLDNDLVKPEDIMTAFLQQLPPECRIPENNSTQKVNGTTGPLFVACQGEVAVVRPDQPAYIAASDEATSCIIVCIRDPSTKATAIAHFDSEKEPQMTDGLAYMLEQTTGVAKGDPKEVDLYMVGAVCDEKHSLPQLRRLLEILHKDAATTYRLPKESVCLWQDNTDERTNEVRFQGLAVDSRTGASYPLELTDHVANDLRGMRLYEESSGTKSNALRRVSQPNGTFRLEVIRYQKLDEKMWRQVLQMNDGVILQHFSTTPKLERDGFAAKVRKNIRRALDVPWEKEFPGGKDLVFEYDVKQSLWKKVITEE